MANPWKEAAESMKGTGISSLGQSYSPTFTPQLVSHPYDAVDDISMNYDVSFPTQDMADRFDYGYGQMVGHITNQDGSKDPWRYRDYGNDYINPDVYANIYGGNKHRRAAKLYAQQYNNPSITDNFSYVGPQQDILDMIAWNNALDAGEIDVDPMYMEDMSYNIIDPALFMTQEAQMSDEPNTFVRTLMENYGRGNPFMQDLGGTYDNYFGETFGMDEGILGLRDVVGDWKIAAADPNWRPTKQIYPDEQYLPSPYTPPSDRQPGFDYTAPALPPGNIGFDRSPNPQALPPEYFEFDRAGPGSDMMDFINLSQQVAGGDSYDQMRYELRRIGVDPTGMGNDEVKQIYDINIGGTTGEEDQFGIV